MTVLLVATGITVGSSGVAFAVCPYSNDYAMEYTNKAIYYGEAGWYYTYNPSVPSPNSDFTLSHLNDFNISNFNFAEVGWYKGFGPHLIATVPHYYFAHGDQYGYVESDSSSTPTVGTNYFFEILYNGYDSTTGKYKWNVYWDGFTLRGSFEVASLPKGRVIGGGEIDAGASSGTQMRVHGIPHFQLQDTSGGSWHNWTPSYMSSKGDSVLSCSDTGLTFKINTAYEDFTSGGQIP